MSAASEWAIVEAAFDPERLAAMESVFAVGNGYLGLRGAPEEGGPSHDPGVVLNGFHETWPIGFFSERRDGRFCINSVTGTDEYTTVVDNNAFTNLMAKENLESAVHVVDWLRGSDPAAHARLVAATGLEETELEDWSRAAELMYVPRHDQLGIVLQNEHFLERKRWDFEGTPADRYPLLLHYHPLEIFRHQAIKQADVVLATYLVGHHFSAEETRGRSTTTTR